MSLLATLFVKDLRVIMRNRTLLVTLLLYPLVMVGILGLVFADPEQAIPVAMVVGPDGNDPIPLEDITISIDMVEAEIDRVARAERYRDEASAQEALRNGEVDAVLIFPDHFLSDVIFQFDRQVTLRVLLDRSDPAKSSVAENVIRASVQQFNEEIVRYKVDAIVDLLAQALDGGDMPPFDRMDFRSLRDSLQFILETEDGLSPGARQSIEDAISFLDLAILQLEDAETTVVSIALPIHTQIDHVESGVLEARDIVVPAAVALSLFWTGILATGSLVVYERESHAQTRLNVSPVGLAPIVASKLILAISIILAQSLLIIGIAKALWDVRLDNLSLLLAMLGAGAFAAVGLGVLVAGLARDTNGTTLLSVLAVFPMMFLSGLFFPISFMPEAAQLLARLIPLTYAVDGLRGAMLREYTFDHAQTDLVVLLALGLITLVVGYARNRKLAYRV